MAKSGKLAKAGGNLSDPVVLAARGREIIQELKAKPAEMQAALAAGTAELSSMLRKAGSLTRGLADFIEKKFNQILENVTEDAGKKAAAKSRGGGVMNDEAAADGTSSKDTGPGKLSKASDLENSSFNGIKADRVRAGTNGKVAVVGRSMGQTVEPYAAGLKQQGFNVETFSGDQISQGALDQWNDLRRDYAPSYIPSQEVLKSNYFRRTRRGRRSWRIRDTLWLMSTIRVVNRLVLFTRWKRAFCLMGLMWEANDEL